MCGFGPRSSFQHTVLRVSDPSLFEESEAEPRERLTSAIRPGSPTPCPQTTPSTSPSSLASRLVAVRLPGAEKSRLHLTSPVELSARGRAQRPRRGACSRSDRCRCDVRDPGAFNLVKRQQRAEKVGKQLCRTVVGGVIAERGPLLTKIPDCLRGQVGHRINFPIQGAVDGKKADEWRSTSRARRRQIPTRHPRAPR